MLLQQECTNIADANQPAKRRSIARHDAIVTRFAKVFPTTPTKISAIFTQHLIVGSVKRIKLTKSEKSNKRTIQDIQDVSSENQVTNTFRFCRKYFSGHWQT